jgi:VWFA-related protein
VGFHASAAAAAPPPLTVVLLDNLNGNLFDPKLREQIAGMADLRCGNGKVIDPACAPAPIAVFLLGSRMELVQDVTTDRNVVRAALRSRFHDNGNEHPNTPAIPSQNSWLPPLPAWNRMTPKGNDLQRRAQATMDALRSLARHLAGMPGRKRLVWVSTSFPFYLNPDPRLREDDDALSYRRQVAAVTNALWRARVAVYPVRPGAEGIVVQADAELSATPAALAVFSTETGGKAWIDDEQLADCFQRVLREGLSSYEISYVPAEFPGAPGLHRVNVRAQRADVRLASPHYYYSVRPAKVGADLDFKQAACDDEMTATAIGLTAELQMGAGEDPAFLLGVNGKALHSGNAPEFPVRLRFDFAVCSFDEHGRPLQHLQYAARTSLNSDEFHAAQVGVLRRTISFRPNPNAVFVRWVVRDPESGELGSVNVPYVAGNPAGNSAQDIALPAPGVSATVAQGEPVASPAADSPETAPLPERKEAAMAPATLPAPDPPEPHTPEEEVRPYCAAISKQSSHDDALSQVCEFALALTERMPNVICNLETHRYWHEGQDPRRDKVTATVTYEDGQESYSNVRINDASPEKSKHEQAGTWSMGEFASILQMLFAPASEAEFSFVRDDAIGTRPVLVFSYRVKESNNVLAYLHAIYSSGGGATLFPGYEGMLWVDRSSAHILRLERKMAKMDPNFPITRVRTVVDYDDMPLGDGSTFVLPAKGEVETCSADEINECAHNVVRFANWHKFRAKTRMVPMPQ